VLESVRSSTGIAADEPKIFLNRSPSLMKTSQNVVPVTFGAAATASLVVGTGAEANEASRSPQATEQFRRLPYADVCENNELRTYSISPSVTGLEGPEG
jgi:hypothetical protein